MSKMPIQSDHAPAAIGPYSQAIRAGETVYLSGQIPLDPATGEVVEGDFADLVNRVFDNLAAIAEAAGGSLDNVVKLNIFLTDLGRFGVVNELMAERFSEPYPARATIEVSGLPKGVPVEMDAVMVLGDG
ncbi:RidA family protein [Wenzhouxiangella sediminis]|uniref:RidA family protein n=1 Tax=Wenzhouxiangella sediminis TaxID=1792836 RepID=A0A3E1K970_9GAMM|nr:RidA family protein [Wenzhouxiangella sediminis]RFF30626.1 RidA family protein [Wenzhouxiangella sediminis]